MKPGKFVKFLTFVTFLFFYVPLFVVVLFSFNSSRSPVWTGFTLKWYVELFTRSYAIWRAFWNSIMVAVLSSTTATVLGTMTAIGLYWVKNGKKKSTGDTFLWFLTYLPFVVPDVIIGISLLLFFSLLQFRLGFSTIVLAHVTFSIPYTMMVVYSRLHGFDKNIVEAAYDLGATETQVLFKVLIPNLVPSIVAAFLLAFTLSIDDFVITFFVAGPGTTTLPIQIYSMIRFGISPTINAISTFMIAGTVLIGFALRKFVRYIF